LKLDRKQVKSAGEHFVCAELARRGWNPALTRDGVERTDILAANVESGLAITIQVKAAGATASWPVGTKGFLCAKSEHEWYVFVHLGDGYSAPRYWLVPRNDVAAAAWVGYHAWRYSPDAKRKRSAGPGATRLHPDDIDGYLDRWDLLELETSSAPWLLPEWIEGQASEHVWQSSSDAPAWPPGHLGRAGRT
jgi:hypothetical protein